MRRSALLVLALALLGCEDKVGDSSTTPTGATTTSSGTTPTGGSTAPVDADADGFTSDVDCDDARADVNPAQDERCNGFDDNCDGVVDTDAIDRITTYADLDGDGSGDDATAMEQCTLGPGRVQLGGDCNDAHPGLNARDDDADGASTCDGDCDDADPSLNLVDGDLDTYTTCDGDCDDADATRSPADGDGDGQSGCGGDCDDTDPAREGLDADGDGFSTCDGDCDDDDALRELTDLDGDTWTTCDGDCDDHNPALNLTDADGDTWSTCAGDCDDNDGTKSPSDVDLDGQSGCAGDCDDTDASVETLDTDGDGWTTCAGDCSDTDPVVHPGATETCDAADRDCDGDPTAGATDQRWWYLDMDGDGFGVSIFGQLTCTQPSPSHVQRGGDCDDNLQAVNPAMPEDCADGVDNDCSGIPDDCDPGGGMPIVDAWNADRMWVGGLTSGAGRAVGAGDFDGDGIDDLVVGGDGYRGRYGRAWVFYGSPTLPASGFLDDQADAALDGSTSDAYSGQQVGSIGDLDGDGIDDLGVAAPRENSRQGALHLLWGGPTRLSGVSTLGTSDLTIPGPNQNSYFAESFTSIGDIDGDGRLDAAIGSFGAESDGQVFLLLGSASRPGTVDVRTVPTLDGDAANSDELGRGRQAIAGGDLDGDGLSDVATSSRNSATWILYGSPTSPSGVIPVAGLPSIVNPLTDGSSTFWGWTSLMADYDGDGRDDLVVGDQSSEVGSQGGGAAWVYLGTAARWAGQRSHTTAEARILGTEGGVLTYSIASLPDLDLDGADELLLGAVLANGVVPESGGIYRFPGGMLGNLRQDDADLMISGDGSGMRFASSMATGDFDGDGLLDLAVGADLGSDDRGRVYLFSNPF